MKWHLDTRCVQGACRPKNGEPRVFPVVQSTTFLYETPEAMGDLFDLKADGFFYTRLGNPTCDVAERKLADLEGGVAAILTSSGMAATMMSILNITQAGGHVVSTSALYGGTFNLLKNTLTKLGIETTFIEPDADDATIEAAFRPNTRLVFGETLSNPSLAIMDIERFACHAHAHHVPLIVDNTFPTPVNCRPIEFGADIVVHSTSKYLDGHATALGGVIVDSGKFDWSTGDYPELTTPDESYHGLVYTEQFGPAAYIARARTQLMRDFGPSPAPQNAFLLTRGMDTLHLRMERHCSNALTIAKALQNDDRVSWVSYPELPGDRYYELAKKYMPGGTCGVISFGVKGGREAAQKFQSHLQLAAIVTHVADTRTCILHPASTTHRQMNDDQLREAGVSPDMVRFSVGIEHVDDILADIQQALEKVNG